MRAATLFSANDPLGVLIKVYLTQCYFALCEIDPLIDWNRSPRWTLMPLQGAAEQRERGLARSTCGFCHRLPIGTAPG
jgi:hypothetical protein